MSFRLKIALGIVLIQLLLLIVLVSISLNFIRFSNEVELSKRATSIATLFSVTTVNGLKSGDIKMLTDAANVIGGQPGVVYVRIIKGADVLVQVGDHNYLAKPFKDDFMIEDVDDGVFDVYHLVVDQDKTLGRVELGLSVTEIADVMAAARKQISVVAFVGMLMSVIIAMLLGNYFARQLKNLRDASRSIAAGNIGYQLYIKGDDELAQTANAFNTMSRKLALLYSEKQAALNKSEFTATNLQDKERRINAILENAGDGIVTIDEYGDIESFNRAAELIFGYSAPEILGQNIRVLLADSMPEDAERPLPSYLAAGTQAKQTPAGEILGRRRDGGTFSMELDVSEMLIEGSVLYICIVRDITERIRAEEELRHAQMLALESARSKFEFIANISHEIRTPMNGVLTMINLLHDSSLTDYQREHVDMLYGSSKALITVVNDILDFSRLEAGQLELEHIEFDLEQTIQDVCRMLDYVAREKGLNLIYLIEGRVPAMVLGDPARVRQILINMVDNAVKFTDHGEVTVKVAVDSESEQQVKLYISVVDTGAGVTPRTQRYILDGHEDKLITGSDHRPGSTGLGLAISRKLIAMMDGEMGIESELGQGSNFWFRISLGLPGPSDVRQQYDYSELHDLKVLIIDHREAWRNFLRTQMQSIGMVVSFADDSLMAVAMLQHASELDEPFRLAIFDMTLADGSGLDLARMINDNPDIVKLKMLVVATTGYRGDSEEVKRVGISGYLSTPVSSGQLYECISAVIRLDVTEHDVLITRHSLADSRAGMHEHVLLVASDEAEKKKLLGDLQSLGYRAHYLDNITDLDTAIGRHYYGVVIIAVAIGLKEDVDAIERIKITMPQEHRVKIIAILDSEAGNQDCSDAGADYMLVRPVLVDELQQALSNSESENV